MCLLVLNRQRVTLSLFQSRQVLIFYLNTKKKKAQTIHDEFALKFLEFSKTLLARTLRGAH